MTTTRAKRWWWASLGGLGALVGMAGLVACEAEASVPGGEAEGLALGGLMTLVVLAILD